MKKFIVFGCIIVSLGVICLYASTTQDEKVQQKVVVAEHIDDLGSEIKVAQPNIQLFLYENCSYCVRVTDFLRLHNLMDKVQLVHTDIPENRELLRSISGRTQVPYLVDGDAGVIMPESLDIIAYLSKKFLVTIADLENVMPIVASTDMYESKKYDSSTFLSHVQASDKPVVILVSTTWCPPCKIFKPIFLQIAEEYAQSCTFICIDGDDDSAIVQQLDVLCYPSIVCYKHGVKINPENYRSQQGLIQVIKQLLLS